MENDLASPASFAPLAPASPFAPPAAPLSFKESGALERRQFLRLLGAGGFGLFLGPTWDQLISWFHPGGTSAYAFDLPAEWIDTLGQPLRGYAAFIGGLQLQRLTVRQIIEPHLKLRGTVRNGLPPTPLWKNMRPTLVVADQIGRRLGENVDTVISAYRSPAYNARCGGAARNSQHLRNVALDLQFQSPPKTVAHVARELRAEGKFRGGVGVYPGFTHIDTRGTNADWG